MVEDAHLGKPLDDKSGGGIEEEGIKSSDFYAMNLIYQMRIYDMLTVIANGIDPDACDKVLEAHARGKSFSPPPLYIPDEE